MKGKVILIYIGRVSGDGPEFLFGVPARDLTEQDVEERGLDVDALLETGLYEDTRPQAKRAKAAKIQEVNDGDGNQEA